MYKYKLAWKFLPVTVFTGLILMCLLNLSSILAEYQAGAKSYSQLEEHLSYSLPDQADAAPEISERGIPPGNPLPKVDFPALQKINPDIEAWLILEDTAINYPVVRSGDNNYYLTHLFDGIPNKSGCLFIDKSNRPGFADRNTIIYGHNMKDGSMLGVLANYRQQAYYDEHSQMLLLTPEGNYTLELLAGYVCDENSDAWRQDFGEDGEFESWLAEAIAKSLFSGKYSASDYDSIVTLSTCIYDYENAFFVLSGGLVPLP